MKSSLLAALAACALACAPAAAQTEFVFSTGGATGPTGPTQGQLDAAYLGTNLEGEVTGNGGIQSWTVPQTAFYRIEAWGGQGYGDFGGRGAHIAGTFQLAQGQALKILVGQRGAPYLNFPSTTYNHQFSGGGGSFVTQDDDTPLVVAGGGGGSHAAQYLAGADGQATEDGAPGALGSILGAGGTNGAGGAEASSADGGGGLLGNGAGVAGGQAFVNGGLGGADEGIAGFGGGGGTSSWNNYRGGGGGGYSGGGGGNNGGVCCAAGGGGGSFNDGTDPVNLPGVRLGDGEVRITVLSGPPIFSKAFAPLAIPPGGTSTLVFVLDSSFNTDPVTGLDFTDNLPAGMVVADPSNANSDCAGTLSAVPAGGTISLAGGAIAATSSCTISVDVTVAAEGVYDNLTSNLDSSLGQGPGAAASLVASEPPTIAKAFQPAVVAPGEVSSLAFTLQSGVLAGATGIGFTDVLPPGLVLASPVNPENGCGGTLDASDGGSSVTLVDGVLAAGQTCEVRVGVTAAAPGSYGSSAGPLASSLGEGGTAFAQLDVVTPPGFGKRFVPDTAAPGTPVVLRFEIDNSGNPFEAGALLFTDPLPAGMVVASPANASSDCGGSLAATPGSQVVALSNGSVAAGASCSIEVTVEAALPGIYNNVSGELVSTLGNSGQAIDTLAMTVAGSRTVTDTGDAGDGVCDASCTLRDAVAASFDGDTVDFDPALSAPVVVELSGPPITVDVALDIVATEGVRTAVRRAAGTGRLFELRSKGQLRSFGIDFEQGTVAPGVTGASAKGGAFLTEAGSILEVQGGTFRDNQAFGSDSLLVGSDGAPASGGAIHAEGDLVLRNCAFVGNLAEGGDGRDGVSGGGNATAGGDGRGGAIHAAGLLDVRNCSFSGNVARGGTGGDGGAGTSGGDGGDGARGGDARGGAVDAGVTAAVSIDFSTLIGNTVEGQPGGAGGAGSNPGVDGGAGPDGVGSGAAIASDATTLLNASAVAANLGAPACDGADISARSDNQVDDTSCPGTEVVGLDTGFAAMDAGALLPHYAPLTGSSVVDAAPDCLDSTGSETVAVDQLGGARPETSRGGPAACDFGAIEQGPVLFADGLEGDSP